MPVNLAPVILAPALVALAVRAGARAKPADPAELADETQRRLIMRAVELQLNARDAERAERRWSAITWTLGALVGVTIVALITMAALDALGALR